MPLMAKSDQLDAPESDVPIEELNDAYVGLTCRSFSISMWWTQIDNADIPPQI